MFDCDVMCMTVLFKKRALHYMFSYSRHDTRYGACMSVEFYLLVVCKYSYS